MVLSYWDEKGINKMLDAVLTTKNKKELYELFDRILTPREINDMGRRFSVAILLSEGKSYGEIRSELNIGYGVVSRVSHHIGYGFRRSNETKIKKRKTIVIDPNPKGVVKYKGAVPIHKMIKIVEK